MKYLNITNKTTEDFGVKSMKELWEKNQDKYKGFSCELPVTFEKSTTKKEDGEDVTTYTMVFSTPDVDRHGDIVLQNFDLKGYKKNPVILDSHNYDSIMHIIGKVNNIRVEDNKLKGEIEFMLKNPKGALAKAMVDGGFLNTSSIGFIPKDFNEKGQITESELLENSLVSVPANARALFEKVAKDIQEDIKEMEKEVDNVEKVIEKKKTIDKQTIILNSILNGLKDLDKKEQKKNELKRSVFKALRQL